MISAERVSRTTEFQIMDAGICFSLFSGEMPGEVNVKIRKFEDGNLTIIFEHEEGSNKLDGHLFLYLFIFILHN